MGNVITLGVIVSDGSNDVSDISVSVNHPFHISVFIMFIAYSCNVFQTPAELNIILNDANDNKPIFQEPSYDITVREVSQTYLSD